MKSEYNETHQKVDANINVDKSILSSLEPD